MVPQPKRKPIQGNTSSTSTPSKSEGRRGHRKKSGERQSTEIIGVPHLKLPIDSTFNIPMDILPLHLQCIRTCHQYVKECATESLMISSEPSSERNDSLSATTQTSIHTGQSLLPPTIMEGIFQRMEQSNPPRRQPPPSDNDFSRNGTDLNALDTMIHKWLTAIQLFVRNNHRPKNAQNVDCRNDDGDDVPVRVLKHLFQILFTATGSSKKISMKRAATFMIHSILQKSSQCRQYFCCGMSSSSFQNIIPDQNNGSNTLVSHDRNAVGITYNSYTLPQNKLILLHWMDMIVSTHDSASDDRTGQYIQNDNQNHCLNNVHLLISDSFHLLTNLCRNFGHLYHPTLNLSVQRYKQLVPSIVIASNKNNIELSGQTDESLLIRTNELRLIRDSAIQKYEAFEQQMQSLIEYAHQFIDVLVPRIGISPSDKIESTMKHNESVSLVRANKSISLTEPFLEDQFENENDIVDDEVAWEDGVLNISDDINSPEEPKHSISHIDAVEQTIASIQAMSGTVLREGELEIDFSNNRFTSDQDSGSLMPRSAVKIKTDAKMKLHDISSELQSKHMKRLSIWIQGLSHADNLVSHGNAPNQSSAVIIIPATNSLVQMTSDQICYRRDILNRALQLKQKLSNLKSSCKQLCKDHEDLNLALPSNFHQPNRLSSSSISMSDNHRSVSSGPLCLQNTSRISAYTRRNKKQQPKHPKKRQIAIMYKNRK